MPATNKLYNEYNKPFQAIQRKIATDHGVTIKLNQVRDLVSFEGLTEDEITQLTLDDVAKITFNNYQRSQQQDPDSTAMVLANAKTDIDNAVLAKAPNDFGSGIEKFNEVTSELFIGLVEDAEDGEIEYSEILTEYQYYAELTLTNIIKERSDKVAAVSQNVAKMIEKTNEIINHQNESLALNISEQFKWLKGSMKANAELHRNFLKEARRRMDMDM